ncbi:MAG: hypothetical protein ABF380_13525 [Akkermansiaceae bacterium]
MTASYGARLCALSKDEGMGADPADIEMHSEVIREPRAELVRLRELVKKEFESNFFNAFFELQYDESLDEFLKLAEQEFLGVGIRF